MKTSRALGNPPITRPRSAPRMHDFAIILLGGLFLLALITLEQIAATFAWSLPPPAALEWGLSLLRVPLGLAYVLFVPGYLLQALLFPRRADLDGIERVGLSVGLSVALVLLLALLLDRLPWGLRFLPILIGQVSLILLLLLAATMRRLTLPLGEAYGPDLRLRPGVWLRALPLPYRCLVLLAGGALLIAAFAAVWALIVPNSAGYMTEFYMLGKDGLAEYYPRAARPGEALAVTLGIVNHEREPQTYRVEVWQRDPFGDRSQLLERTSPFVLTVDQTLTWSQSWHPAWAGDDQQVEFLLFIAGSPEPYRSLRLWIDVTP